MRDIIISILIVLGVMFFIATVGSCYDNSKYLKMIDNRLKEVEKLIYVEEE